MASIVDQNDIKLTNIEDVYEFTLEDVQKCDNNDKFWVYCGNTIYDITHFKKNHPGGDKVFTNKGGKDISKELVYHTKRTRESLFMYQIGVLKNDKNDVGCVIM